MQNNNFKKGLVTAIIILFIVMCIVPSTGKIDAPSSKTIINEGSLSGIVYDLSGNTIEGALVRVYFHETYEENYSDSNGYYHVTNIPLCYCVKNATCSKEGYITEWVLLTITEGTNHDFYLNSTNSPPERPDIHGPTHGKVGHNYECIFYSTDPELDDIKYIIDWGDSTSYTTSFYQSGVNAGVAHNWSAKGTYIIKAKAIDIHGAESDCGESYPIEITDGKSRIVTNSLFLRFLEHFPLLERLINLL